eukprot:28622-Pelagomonas_calceolata.AAC.1
MEIHDPELFALEKQVAQTMLHLKQQQQQMVDCRNEQLSEEASGRWQALREREAQFLAFHVRQFEGSLGTQAQDVSLRDRRSYVWYLSKTLSSNEFEVCLLDRTMLIGRAKILCCVGWDN